MSVTLTATENAYIKKVYEETGMSVKQTLDQFSKSQVSQWQSALSGGYIPKDVTITQYLDKMFPASKRTAFKAKLEKEAPEIKKLQEKADVEIKKLEDKKQAQKGGTTEEPEKKSSNLVWWILGGVGVLAGAFFGFKALNK